MVLGVHIVYFPGLLNEANVPVDMHSVIIAKADRSG